MNIYLRFSTVQRTVTTASGKKFILSVPQNIPLFLWMWERGRFVECHARKVANRVRINDRRIPVTFANTAAFFRNEIMRRNATPLLNAGSLLGKVFRNLSANSIVSAWKLE